MGTGGTEPEGAAVAVLTALTSGARVALGFEASTMLPDSPCRSVG